MSEDAGLRLQVSGRVQPLPRQLREGRPTRHEVRGPSAQLTSAQASIFRQNERLRPRPIRSAVAGSRQRFPRRLRLHPGPDLGRAVARVLTRPVRGRAGAGVAPPVGRRHWDAEERRHVLSGQFARVCPLWTRLDSTRQQEQVRAGSEPGPGGAAFGRHTGRADPRGTAPGGLRVTGRGRSPRRAHARPRRPLTPVPLS